MTNTHSCNVKSCKSPLIMWTSLDIFSYFTRDLLLRTNTWIAYSCVTQNLNCPFKRYKLVALKSRENAESHPSANLTRSETKWDLGILRNMCLLARRLRNIF